MYVAYAQALEIIKTYNDECAPFVQEHNRLVIICPSFELLYPVGQRIQAMPSFLALGAQDCSAYPLGAHTGQVSALSLAELGCSYCIVGHSEQRDAEGQTSTLVAHKVMRLLEHRITPIVCIGEDATAYRTGTTYTLLKQQLDPVLEISSRTTGCIYYAYEPVWAIGSGIVPTEVYLKNTLTWLSDYLSSFGRSCKLLYGGSVTAAVLPMLASFEKLNGVLVGSASVDFQKFKNIVSWNK